MGLTTRSSQSGLEGMILETLARQKRNGEGQHLVVSVARIKAELKVSQEAPVHAWANDLCARHALTAFLMGGDRMGFTVGD